MKLLSIDSGTYSVKISVSNIERKGLSYDYFKEFYIEDFLLDPQLKKDADITDIQLIIIKKFIQDNNFEGKIIYSMPAVNLTTRYLTLPVGSKKKANMMIPFQLDKNLPFLLSDIQYDCQLIHEKNSTYAIASIAELSRFDEFFKKMNNNMFLPDIITSEVSVLQSMVDRKKIDGPCCILDIGYESSKAYFIVNGKIVINYISFVGGKNIDINLERSYNLKSEEVKEYKHKNIFFLTEKQYLKAPPEQQELANLMEQIFKRLIDDFRKWEVGFKINFGESISNIYLCGGCSNINNIANFLSQTWRIKIQLFRPYDDNELQKISKDNFDKNTYAFNYLLGLSFTGKLQPVNLKKGAYLSSSSTEIPLHSTAYIGIRVLVISLLLILFLSFERIFLYVSQESLDKKIIKVLKKPELNLSRRDQRRFKKTPQFILKRVLKANEEINKEIEVVRLIFTKNALHPYIVLNKALKTNGKWEVVKFQNEGNKCKAFFKVKEKTVFKDLTMQINNLDFKDKKVLENTVDKELIFEFTGS